MDPGGQLAQRLDAGGSLRNAKVEQLRCPPRRLAPLLLRELEAERSLVERDGTPATPACSGACDELAVLDVLALSPLQAQAELFRLQQLAHRG